MEILSPDNRSGTDRQDRLRLRDRTGLLIALLRREFRDAAIRVGENTTELVIQVADAQELFGLLDRLRDHAVTIISVNREE